MEKVTIDFDYKFVYLNGKTIPEGPDRVEDVDGKKVTKKSPPLTLRTICENVLLGTRVSQIKCPRCKNEFDKPEVLSGEEKSKRYQLAKKIHESTEPIDLQSGDIPLLKKLIGIVYPQITSGQAWEILDPPDAGGEKGEIT